MKKSKFCQHRHTQEDHPNCFTNLWYKKPGQSLCYLDIEASGLDADNSWMLSWAIKPATEKSVLFDYITFEDIFESPGKVKLDFDAYLTETLIENMRQFTGIVTYYGTGFDIKYIRAKAMQ